MPVAPVTVNDYGMGLDSSPRRRCPPPRGQGHPGSRRRHSGHHERCLRLAPRLGLRRSHRLAPRDLEGIAGGLGVPLGRDRDPGVAHQRPGRTARWRARSPRGRHRPDPSRGRPGRPRLFRLGSRDKRRDGLAQVLQGLVPFARLPPARDPALETGVAFGGRGHDGPRGRRSPAGRGATAAQTASDARGVASRRESSEARTALSTTDVHSIERLSAGKIRHRQGGIDDDPPSLHFESGRGFRGGPGSSRAGPDHGRDDAALGGGRGRGGGRELHLSRVHLREDDRVPPVGGDLEPRALGRREGPSAPPHAPDRGRLQARARDAGRRGHPRERLLHELPERRDPGLPRSCFRGGRPPRGEGHDHVVREAHPRPAGRGGQEAPDEGRPAQPLERRQLVREGEEGPQGQLRGRAGLGQRRTGGARSTWPPTSTSATSPRPASIPSRTSRPTRPASSPST